MSVRYMLGVKGNQCGSVGYSQFHVPYVGWANVKSYKEQTVFVINYP